MLSLRRALGAALLTFCFAFVSVVVTPTILENQALAKKRKRKRTKTTPKAPKKAPPPAPAAPATPFRGPTRLDFDDRLIQGQTNKSGAVYLFDRKETGISSMVRRRRSFKALTLRTIYDR